MHEIFYSEIVGRLFCADIEFKCQFWWFRVVFGVILTEDRVNSFFALIALDPWEKSEYTCKLN